MTKTEVLLIVIGGIFVIEALSVAIQVFAFQRFRKRVFLMAPIHHHFELAGWSETKIILRFWIVAAICAAIGFTLYQASISREAAAPRGAVPGGGAGALRGRGGRADAAEHGEVIGVDSGTPDVPRPASRRTSAWTASSCSSARPASSRAPACRTRRR